MKRICVFLGSSAGSRPEYRAAAAEFGTELVRRNIGLVYGGSNVGLMGVAADAVLGAGGEAIGIVPEHLISREVGHTGLTKLRVVRCMHERKALMATWPTRLWLCLEALERWMSFARWSPGRNLACT
jgi:uncharacterized protein (TIGR00730 family)